VFGQAVQVPISNNMDLVSNSLDYLTGSQDLIGLRAETAEGLVLGTIVAVPNYGAGDILEVAPPVGETLLFPFTRKIVPQVDFAGGKVIIEPPIEVEGEPEAGAEKPGV